MHTQCRLKQKLDITLALKYAKNPVNFAFFQETPNNPTLAHMWQASDTYGSPISGVINP